MPSVLSNAVPKVASKRKSLLLANASKALSLISTHSGDEAGFGIRFSVGSAGASSGRA
jgi:hypothetical protein